MVGMEMGAATMENNTKVPQNYKENYAAQQFHIWHASEEKENITAKTSIPCSLQHYLQY